MAHKVGQPLKFESPEYLQTLIDAYFEQAKTNGDPLTITGLALALDTSRETLINYEAREKYFDTIKRAKLKCQQYAENHLFGGKNATGAIFSLKNNYGWKDKTEVDTTISGELNTGSIDAKAAAEYAIYLKNKK